jgi:hypothetical protein
MQESSCFPVSNEILTNAWSTGVGTLLEQFLVCSTVDTKNWFPRPRLCRASCGWNHIPSARPRICPSLLEGGLHTTRRFRLEAWEVTAGCGQQTRVAEHNQTTKREYSVAESSNGIGNSGVFTPNAASSRNGQLGRGFREAEDTCPVWAVAVCFGTNWVQRFRGGAFSAAAQQEQAPHLPVLPCWRLPEPASRLSG